VKRKSKLKRLRPNNPHSIVIDDSLSIGRNRKSREFGQIVHEKEEELSDYVTVRLALARARAMQKYREARV
jgi:hypothetical protein